MSSPTPESSQGYPVVLVPYDPSWPQRFAEEKEAVATALGDRVLAIEHVGSTAVPGLRSKPTIDIMVGIRRLSEAPPCIAALESFGYVYRPDGEATIPERRYFHKGPPGSRTFHIHMVEFASPFWMGHVLFRNFLRAHPDRAAAYASLKQEFAARYTSDRVGYTDAKGPFIEAVLAEARRESAGAGPWRVIFHVDMDAFYVSVERREQPELVGKPVIVGADPKGGKGRGVVMACSYEARGLGIRSGMPISLAWKKLPDAVYLPPNYDLYGSVSESVMGVLREHADILEHSSIDEAFLEVTPKVTGFDAAADYGRRVKTAVQDREGLACTIGAAPNKSTAKIASDLAKPDGLLVIRPEEVPIFLEPLPVTRISGVGTKTAQILEHAGVTTIGQLAAFPGGELKKLLGKNSVWLWGIAKGIEQMPVEERPDPKSISVERTFDRDVADWSVVLETLDSIAHNVYLRAKGQGASFGNAGIKIRFEGFQTHLRERKLPSHILDEAALRAVARDLVKEFESRGRKVRLLGVRVTDLVRPKTRQPTLTAFDGSES
ncbi:MAG TPA: DNA polymerase IV [Thermoplasmata archaeon]|nr:DNA polymerase IV [Thermoplasmata archaeon]